MREAYEAESMYPESTGGCYETRHRLLWSSHGPVQWRRSTRQPSTTRYIQAPIIGKMVKNATRWISQLTTGPIVIASDKTRSLIGNGSVPTSRSYSDDSRVSYAGALTLDCICLACCATSSASLPGGGSLQQSVLRSFRPQSGKLQI